MAKTHEQVRAEFLASPEVAALIAAAVSQGIAQAGTAQVAAKKVAARPALIVRLNDEKAKAKYGEVTIGKLVNETTFVAKVGIHADQLKSLIEELTAAAEVLGL